MVGGSLGSIPTREAGQGQDACATGSGLGLGLGEDPVGFGGGGGGAGWVGEAGFEVGGVGVSGGGGGLVVDAVASDGVEDGLVVAEEILDWVAGVEGVGGEFGEVGGDELVEGVGVVALGEFVAFEGEASGGGEHPGAGLDLGLGALLQRGFHHIRQGRAVSVDNVGTEERLVAGDPGGVVVGRVLHEGLRESDALVERCGLLGAVGDENRQDRIQWFRHIGQHAPSAFETRCSRRA